jgi:urea transport system permease protein
LTSAIIEGIFNGISIGAVLLLAALGLAIVFGLMGVINMAHGEFMMLGAYTTLMVQNAFKPLKGVGEPLILGGLSELYIFVALVAAFLFTALLGILLERTVIRYLYGRPLETLLATWGVSLILQQFVRSVSWQFLLGLAIFTGLWALRQWGLPQVPAIAARLGRWQTVLWVPISVLLSLGIAGGVGSGRAKADPLIKPWFGALNQDVTAPKWLQGGMTLAGAQFPFARIFILLLTAGCIAGLFYFLQQTSWGLRIRAVTQNRDMSACLGIPTQTVDSLTFAIGSGLAGIAGCAVSLLGSVGPNTGQNYIVDTFMVVVVGGVGKLIGSIVAAIGIGIATYVVGSGTLVLAFSWLKPVADFFTFFATTNMAKVMVFVLIIAFLQVRPAGLFPQKGRSVDA